MTLVLLTYSLVRSFEVPSHLIFARVAQTIVQRHSVQVLCRPPEIRGRVCLDSKHGHHPWSFVPEIQAIFQRQLSSLLSTTTEYIDKMAAASPVLQHATELHARANVNQ
ncbi:hypothetical protein BDV97DRAFT_138 [Delphinella strobiligena]|nr:hypothetical protein BDV97DRAFT_138 [Delphinella strobiligena]